MHIEKIKLERKIHFDKQDKLMQTVLKFNKLFPEYENVRATFKSENYILEWEYNGKEYSINSPYPDGVTENINKIIEHYGKSRKQTTRST